MRGARGTQGWSDPATQSPCVSVEPRPRLGSGWNLPPAFEQSSNASPHRFALRGHELGVGRPCSRGSVDSGASGGDAIELLLDRRGGVLWDPKPQPVSI